MRASLLFLLVCGCACGATPVDAGLDAPTDAPPEPATDGGTDVGDARVCEREIIGPRALGPCDPSCSEERVCVFGWCECPLGTEGERCQTCSPGYEVRDGGCALIVDGDFDHWPNEVSVATSDPWLVAHHDQIRVMRPRILALDFVNARGPDEVRPLLQQIIAGFREGSRPLGDVDPSAAPQLEMELVGIRDLRDGVEGRSPAPSGFPYENGTLYPRRPKEEEGYWRFDYATLFSEEFAEHLGFPDGEGGFFDLCEATERGLLHELWIVGSADVTDVNAAEVLAETPLYSRTGNRLPGVDRCAGNGCFDLDVPSCGRTVRIGFVNHARGPGCYLHSHGHGMESAGRHGTLPAWSLWWRAFARLDLNARYDLPFDDLYAVSCEAPPCIAYPSPSRVTIRQGSSTFDVDPYDAMCGNVHFPPNATAHYDDTNDTDVASSCRNFGREVCDGAPRAVTVSAADWERYETLAPDCGGAFLIWWYQSMPAYGTNQRFDDGTPMRSVWPFMYY